MKKKIFVLLISTLLILMLSSCNAADTESDEEFSGLEFTELGISNRPVYDDLKSLEDNSDLIVVGKFISDAQQEEFYQDDSNDVLLMVVSTNTIEVSQVIKGDIQVGDTVLITQRYGTVDNRFLYISRLTPMLKDDCWLFFLTTRENGTCYCTGDNAGRYPVENFSYSRIAFTDNENLGVYYKEDFREDIYNEILEKYDL